MITITDYFIFQSNQLQLQLLRYSNWSRVCTVVHCAVLEAIS